MILFARMECRVLAFAIALLSAAVPAVGGSAGKWNGRRLWPDPPIPTQFNVRGGVQTYELLMALDCHWYTPRKSTDRRAK
jgi:hypothetical protein